MISSREGMPKREDNYDSSTNYRIFAWPFDYPGHALRGNQADSAARAQKSAALSCSGSHVILMFGKGSELRDPEGMLKGTEKHVRYIKIVEASDIEAPDVRRLLENAVAAQQS